MRIIGGHDYYDSGLAWGRDEEILFLRSGDRSLSAQDANSLGIAWPRLLGAFQPTTRNQRSVIRRRPSYFLRDVCADSFNSRDFRYLVRSMAVIFCGKHYQGLIIDCQSTSTQFRLDKRTGTFMFWSFDALQMFIEIHNLSFTVDPTQIRQYFAVRDLTPDVKSRIIEERISIMSAETHGSWISEQEWQIDQPTLGALEFFRAVDPVTAFQELSMWIGGVIGTHSPDPVQITDNRVKIEKHGFDTVTSFRRAPTGKRS